MRCFRTFTLMLLAACHAFAVSVYTLDEQFSQTNQTVLRFRIENNSGDTLSGIELRYRVVQETSGIAEPDLYYLPGGFANWVIEDSINATLVVYFPGIILYPNDTLGGSSGFAIGLHNTDWSEWSKDDDPSQPAGNTFSMADNIEILSGGFPLLLEAGKVAGCPVVQFVEITKDSLTLQVVQQFDSDSTFVNIKNKDGIAIRANLSESVLDSLNQILWHGAMLTQDTVEHRGELSVECNGNILAYFAYGWTPTGAANAVDRKLWESVDSFVEADFDMGFNRGLGDGQRLAMQRDSLGYYLDARQVANWKFYRKWEKPGENPLPLVLSPVIMQYDKNDVDSLTLEWTSIEGITWYRLLVLKDSLMGDSAAFIDTVESKIMAQTTARIPVQQPGNYIWFAEPLVEVPMDENKEGENYYFVFGNNSISSDTLSGENPPVMYAPWYKKFVSWAKGSLGTVSNGMASVASSLVVEASLSLDISQVVSPFGIVQIFENLEGTLTTRVNEITKDMTWLKESYKSEYVFDALVTNKCFKANAFCAMKDTRMLVERWIGGFNEKNWNKVYLKEKLDGNKNYTVSQRCWLTMAQMLNHYYGGSIASDEILYYVRGGFSDTTGGGPIETMQAVNYALGMEIWNRTELMLLVNIFKARGLLPSSAGWFVGTPSFLTIVDAIDAGKVIGVSQLNGGAQGSHSMVLNGYRIDMDGKFYVHLLNTDNMGSDEWRYYGNLLLFNQDVIASFFANGIAALNDALKGTSFSHDMFFSFYIPPDNVQGRLADSTIFKDSDNDGIVDFDESVRFGTDPLNLDSDDDGIDDFMEIEDFMKCNSKPVNARNSDIDGDGLSVARDVDSDGDGYCDNQEMSDCERFNANRYPADAIPGCKNADVALLAKESLSLNDRASCRSLNNSYCPIASYGSTFNGVYGVSLGVSAAIGNVYSAKSVLLRDRAIVYGNLETAGVVIRQSSTASAMGAVIENSVHAESQESAYAPNFNVISPAGNFSIQNHRNINSGEIVFSSIFGPGANNTAFMFNSNSELVFNQTGDLLAGSLEFQNGAKLHAPVGESVIFHVGDEFQWKGTIVATDMVFAAQHIKIYYYGTRTVYVQADFAGTIVAPNAEVSVGQSGKQFYGAIFAKSIVVHQDTKITWVPFVADSIGAFAYACGSKNLNYRVDFRR